MDSTYKFPKLRWPLELSFDSSGPHQALIIRCPLGISPAPMALNSAIAPVVGALDGSRSFEQILASFEKQGLSEKLLRELIEILDSGLFLANSRFFAAEQNIKEQFTTSKVREAALAGATYPADATGLKKEIANMLSASSSACKSSGSLLSLMAPHIDYRRGGICYGMTYSALAEREEELYLILGTAHQYSSHMFHLTAKDFASPIGNLECDLEFVAKLANLHGLSRSFADEILHRKEHSLELQVPFLKYFRPQSKIVPILVGSFHKMVAEGKPPREDEEFDSFSSALAECIVEQRKLGRKITLICGVDMAHVGQAFGDSERLNPNFMERIAERDREYLTLLEQQDLNGLFAHIYEDQDARRICGFPTMYLMIDVLNRLNIRYRAQMLDYRQAVDYQRDCAVSFAGMAFFETKSSH